MLSCEIKVTRMLGGDKAEYSVDTPYGTSGPGVRDGSGLFGAARYHSRVERGMDHSIAHWNVRCAVGLGRSYGSGFEIVAGSNQVRRDPANKVAIVRLVSRSLDCGRIEHGLDSSGSNGSQS